MAKFLTTIELAEWITKIIEESERELIILAPYIQTSSRLEKALNEANARGVEILLIYRQETLKKAEKEKFLAISNLNLMHHPNLHAKCYLNEHHFLITSMNMYEYSEKNNREMGILIENEDLDQGFFIKEEEESYWDHWDDRFKSNDRGFDKVKKEIWDIIRGAELEKKSTDTIENGFEFEMLLTEEEWCKIACEELNELFVHKKFEPNPMANNLHPICKNFYDRIDVGFDNRGVFFEFNFMGNQNRSLMDAINEMDIQDSIDHFKVFIGKKSDHIYLYRLYNDTFWESGETPLRKKIKQYKLGIDYILNEVKGILKK
jgi:hypothetical protein